MIRRALGRTRFELWDRDLLHAAWPHRLLVRSARIFTAVLRDVFVDGQINLRAMSLVYTTLLSLVPLIAFSFSVLKGFGVHQRVVEPALAQFLQPLGPRGEEITTQIISFVDNIRADILGAAGLALLIWTAFSLVKKMEESFNFVWQVQNSRSWARRFSEYISVLLIGPVTIFLALGLTASFTDPDKVQEWISVGVVSETIVSIGKLAPYFLVIAIFTFLYAFMPNTRVRIPAAFAGAVTAGVLWQTVGAAFAAFVASSSPTTMIYSGFAILILFLVWLYLSWLILLLGAEVSFYVQNPEYARTGRTTVTLSNRERERLALLVMYHVARAHRGRDEAWDVDRIATHVGIPGRSMAYVMDRLTDAGLLVETEDRRLFPGRDADVMTVAEVLDAIRDPDSRGHHPTLRPEPAVDELLAELESVSGECLAGRTLAELAERDSFEEGESGTEGDQGGAA